MSPLCPVIWARYAGHGQAEARREFGVASTEKREKGSARSRNRDGQRETREAAAREGNRSTKQVSPPRRGVGLRSLSDLSRSLAVRQKRVAAANEDEQPTSERRSRPRPPHVARDNRPLPSLHPPGRPPPPAVSPSPSSRPSPLSIGSPSLALALLPPLRSSERLPQPGRHRASPRPPPPPHRGPSHYP